MASCFIITRVTNTVNDVSKLEEIGDSDGLCNRSNLLSNMGYRRVDMHRERIGREESESKGREKNETLRYKQCIIFLYIWAL